MASPGFFCELSAMPWPPSALPEVKPPGQAGAYGAEPESEVSGARLAMPRRLLPGQHVCCLSAMRRTRSPCCPGSWSNLDSFGAVPIVVAYGRSVTTFRLPFGLAKAEMGTGQASITARGHRPDLIFAN